MASFAIRPRALAGILVLTAALLLALPAQAQSPYTMTINIDGLANGNSGNYTNLLTYAWGPSSTAPFTGVASELTFTLPADATSVTLMQAAAANDLFPTAELQHQFQGTATVTILMSNVHIESVALAGDLLPSPYTLLDGSPALVVTLRFTGVTYTFQPLTPTGQKAGPPVTYSSTFPAVALPTRTKPTAIVP